MKPVEVEVRASSTFKEASADVKQATQKKETKMIKNRSIMLEKLRKG